MKFSLFLLLGLSTVSSLPAATTADFSVVVNYDFANDGTIDLPGRLFQPSQATANPTAKYPLVIYLHGSGEAGSDNVSQIDSNIDNLLAGAKANGFYIYAPQSTLKTLDCWDSFPRLNDVMLVAGQLVRDYNIDPSRVYITGISAGGGGALILISNFTNMTPAAATISANDPVTAANVVNKPIWMFASRNDPTVPVSVSRNNVNAIREADPTIGTALTFPLVGSAYYTYYSSYSGSGLPEDGASYYSQRNLTYSEYTSGGHAVWPNAYGEAPLYTWLLAQNLANQTTPLSQPTTAESLLFDFGPTITGTVSGNVWNSPGGTNASPLPMAAVGTGTGTEKTLSAAVVFAYANTGHRTPVILSVTKGFSGIATGTSSSVVYPASVTDEGWEQGGTTSNANSIANPGELLLSGLTPGTLYRLKCYGSDTSTNNNSPTRYTIDNSTSIYADLATRGNVNSAANFDHVVADSNGQVRIEVTPSPSTSGAALLSTISALEVAPVTTRTYSAWESLYFGSDTTDGAPTATPQRDGVTNIQKYFSNIDPTRPVTVNDRAALPNANVTTYNSIRYVAMTYRQSATLTGLTVQVQTSTDLKSWTTVTPTTLSSVSDSITKDSTITAGVPTGSAPQMFMRLVFSGY